MSVKQEWRAAIVHRAQDRPFYPMRPLARVAHSILPANAKAGEAICPAAKKEIRGAAGLWWTMHSLQEGPGSRHYMV